jgi:hypothetical protein
MSRKGQLLVSSSFVRGETYGRELAILVELTPNFSNLLPPPAGKSAMTPTDSMSCSLLVCRASWAYIKVVVDGENHSR